MACHCSDGGHETSPGHDRRPSTLVDGCACPKAGRRRSRSEPFEVKGRERFQRERRLHLGGIFLGSILLTLASFSYYSHRAKHAPAIVPPPARIVPTAPVTVASPAKPPASVPAKIEATSLRINSIALGDPRLAVINGRELAEGDALTLQIGGANVVLHVVKIDEGAVSFSQGSSVFAVKMAPEELHRSPSR